MILALPRECSSTAGERFPQASKLLLLDLASTIIFLVLFLLAHYTMLSVGLGIRIEGPVYACKST
jgi:hypothetical protein